METCAVAIRFPEMEVGHANKAVAELRGQLLDAVTDIKIETAKDEPGTQDLGTTLIAVLGTPAIYALAVGLSNWMMKRRQSITVEIDGERTTFQANGPIDETAARIAETLARRRKNV